MGKVKFGIEVTKENGYERKDKIAFLDVTEKAKDIFGNVTKASLIIGRYYGLSESEESWKKKMENYDTEGLVDKSIRVLGTSIYIEFENGKTVEFDTSEWGSIRASCSLETE